LDRARGDRGNLKNELEKIEILSITKKNISSEDILKLTNLSENYNIFELVDNYLAKNQKKVSKIINENNFVNEDCMLIIRTLLSRSKRLLALKQIESTNSNKDQVITSYKPPIFWKEKEIVKKQMSEWSEEEIKNNIYKLTDLEILIKSNTTGINLVSDFVCNY
jgi:DNA polymerase-3 subunit delta